MKIVNSEKYDEQLDLMKSSIETTLFEANKEFKFKNRIY